MRNIAFVILGLALVLLAYVKLFMHDGPPPQPQQGVAVTPMDDNSAMSASNDSGDNSTSSSDNSDNDGSTPAKPKVPLDQSTLPNLDRLVNTDKDGNLHFDADSLDKLNLTQIQNGISALSMQQSDSSASDNESLLVEVVAQNTADAGQGIYTDNLGCSDELCGVVLSSGDRQAISSGIQGIVSDQRLSGNIDLKALPIRQHNGRYYGILVGLSTPASDQD